MKKLFKRIWDKYLVQECEVIIRSVVEEFNNKVMPHFQNQLNVLAATVNNLDKQQKELIESVKEIKSTIRAISIREK